MPDSLGRHPLLDALWETLPPAGSSWSRAEQDAWLRVAEEALKLVYPTGKEG